MGIKEAYKTLETNYIWLKESLDLCKKSTPRFNEDTDEVDPIVYSMLLIKSEKRRTLEIIAKECPEVLKSQGSGEKRI